MYHNMDFLKSSLPHFYSQGGAGRSDSRYSGNELPMGKSNSSETEKRLGEQIGDNLKALREEGNNHGKVLYAEHLPPHLQDPVTICTIFENVFGAVEKVKILQRQRSTALVQMKSVDIAKNVVLSQDKLKRLDSNIFIKFCTNVKDIKIGREDAMNRDFTRKGGASNNPMFPGQLPFGMNQGFFGSPGFNLSMNGCDENSRMMLSNPYGSQSYSCCLFVSRLPEELANLDSIANLLGVYGDVNKVQMIKNGSALVEMAQPDHATRVKNYLDGTKIGENKMLVSYSNKPSIRKMNENQDTFKDYSRAGVHRFYGLKPGHKMLRSFYRPSAELFVSRFETGKVENLRKYFEDSGYTVKDVKGVGQKGDMAIVTLDSVEQGIKALAKLHNTMPEELGEKKGRRGITLNFAISSNKKGNFKKTTTEEDTKTDADMEESSKTEDNTMQE